MTTPRRAIYKLNQSHKLNQLHKLMKPLTICAQCYYNRATDKGHVCGYRNELFQHLDFERCAEFTPYLPFED